MDQQNMTGEEKAKPGMKSPNERMKGWRSALSAEGRQKMEWMFGDLDQPVTDIMWFLAAKFLGSVPGYWC